MEIILNRKEGAQSFMTALEQVYADASALVADALVGEAEEGRSVGDLMLMTEKNSSWTAYAVQSGDALSGQEVRSRVCLACEEMQSRMKIRRSTGIARGLELVRSGKRLFGWLQDEDG